MLSSPDGCRAYVRWLLCAQLCIAGCERETSGDAKTLPARRGADTVAAARVHDASEAAPPLVLFLGDSISAGLDLPAERAFPAVVQRRLAARGLHFRLANAGVSGDTSAGGLRRVEWLLRQKPDVVVIELGANDGLRGLPVAALESNLRAIIDKVRVHGAKVLLLGMVLPPSYGTDYVSAFAEAYARVAREQNVPFAPFFMRGVAGESQLNLPDGIHPNAEGHERLADTVSEALAPLLAP